MSGYVLDASVAVTALTEPGSGAADLLADTDTVFQAPSIFDVEVTSALRGLVRGGKYDRTAAGRADRRPDHPARRTVARLVTPAPRIWELRENLTPYDAAYVALAVSRTTCSPATSASPPPATRCEIHISQ